MIISNHRRRKKKEGEDDDEVFHLVSLLVSLGEPYIYQNLGGFSINGEVCGGLSDL